MFDDALTKRVNISPMHQKFGKRITSRSCSQFDLELFLLSKGCMVILNDPNNNHTIAGKCYARMLKCACICVWRTPLCVSIKVWCLA